MAKQKKPEIGKEKSLKELKALHKQSTYMLLIIVDIIILYIGMNYAGYAARFQGDTSIPDFFSKMGKVGAGGLFMFWNFNGGGFVEGFAKNLPVVFGILILVDMLLYAEHLYAATRIHNSADTSKGRTRWATEKEIADKYSDFVDEEKKRDYVHAYNNAICSQHTFISMNTRKHFHALNMLILGATGSGKSRYYLKPNILQMNTSYVVTDPKGEILDSCGEMLWRNGYNVRVFDITPEGMQSGFTSRYNPLKYCKEESDIRKLMEAFMKNVNPDASKKGGGSADPFWDEATRMFLSTCVAFLVQHPSDGDERTYGEIEKIGGGKWNACFASLCELTRMAGNKWVDGKSKVKNNTGRTIEPDKNAPQKNSEIGMIMENIRAYEAEIQGCDPALIEKPYVLMEWENFWGTPEKTATTVMTTTAVKLDAFNIAQVKALTSIDTINLEEFGKGRDALFLIIPPTDKTYNFLISFLYTQLFDILYSLGSRGVEGSKNLKLKNGELVRFFPPEEVESGTVDAKVAAIKKSRAVHIDGKGVKHGTYKTQKGGKTVEEKVAIDDGWYEILDADGELVTRRSTKAAADQYIADLKDADLMKGRAPAIPCHVRFLMDEFPNIGEVPEFKEKLATMRGYEISATVICQSITQLKGMYPDDYQVIDGNCPFLIFLGGDENENNEYLSKKIGNATGQDETFSGEGGTGAKKTSVSHQLSEKALLRAEDFGRIDYSQEVVFIYGEMPIMDDKFDYPGHKNYRLSRDFAADCGTDAMVFDRSKLYTDASHIKIFTKGEEATAMVDVKPFSMASMLSILGVNEASEEKIEETVKRNIRKHSFEDESSPVEF